MPRFTHDAMTDHVWECSGFDVPWNGWVSPIVSASVVLCLMEESGWHWTAKGRTITVVDDPGDDDVERWVPLEPDEQRQWRVRMDPICEDLHPHFANDGAPSRDQ